MSLEEIQSQLSARDIEVQVLVYHQSLVSVYKGRYRQYPAAIKVLAAVTDMDRTQLEKEFWILQNIRHEHVVSLYDCFWTCNSEQYFFVLVLEWCDKDLATDLKQRRDNSYPWSEAELWEMTWDLVSTLAFMQEKGLAHRDIKPENVFLTRVQGKTLVKIGDFGASKFLAQELTIATMVGTPYYLSPSLRQGLLSNSRQVQHNVYKSDVYSLGLTLLTCVLLNQPMLQGQGAEDERMSLAIGNAGCSSQFKAVLGWMLVSDERQRCDFIELSSWLKPGIEPQVGGEYESRKQVSLQLPGAEYHSEAVLQGSSNQSQVPDNPYPELPAVPVAQAVPSYSTLCIRCGKEVDRKSDDDVVQLDCDPATHLFCTKACFAQYCSGIEELVCPKCKAPIAPDIIYQMHNKGRIARGLETVQNVGSKLWSMVSYFYPRK